MIFGKNTKQYLLGGGIVLSALIILILVVKYVPLDPTKVVLETVEEKIHFEVQPDLEIENITPKDNMDSNKDVNLVLEPTFNNILIPLSDVMVLPKLTSSKSFVRSPNLTLVLTTPSSKSSRYKSFCFLAP